MNPSSRKFIGALRRQIDQHFNLSEINIVCFDIGVDFEHLAGDSKIPKIQDLLLLLARQDRIAELLELLEEERADVAWASLPADFDLGGGEDEAGSSPADNIAVGNVGSGAAVAVGPGASVNVQTTNVQNYDFSGTIAGDVNIAGDVHIDAADLPIPDPPPTELPPAIDRFVGREAELAQYKTQLQQAQIAVISGMPGMGKTMLAAAVAHEAAPSEKIFWHTFRPGEGIETVVWQLAAFLAHRGQDDLWQLLQRARLTRGTPPPAETLLNYLVEMLRGRGYLLVLDDIHIVDDDPQLNLFIERTRRVVLAGDIKIILTSRKLPEFVTLVETAFIDGLSAGAVGELLRQRNIDLPADLLARFHERTQGNAELVMLSIDLLRDSSRPEKLIDNLAEVENVERFILKEIDGRLEDTEPEVMNAVSVLNLLGYQGSRYAISAVLDGQNVRRVVRDLADRFLLLAHNGEQGAEYGQHAIVREFYYDGLSRRQRQVLHRLAGEYYLDEKMDHLRAANHLLLAGEADRAAGLVTGDVWRYINQGQSRALRDLLVKFGGQELPETTWRQVQLSLGEVYDYLGESGEARKCFEGVLARLGDGELVDADRLQQIKAYRGLGELLAQEKPQEALTWLQTGLETLAGLPDAVTDDEALLYLKLGTIHFWLGDLTKARPALERSLALLPDTPSQARARTLVTLGGVVFESQNEFEQALAMMEQALAISRQLRDHFQESRILSTLAGYRFRAGEWRRALPEFEGALEVAVRIGSDKARAIGEMNLGTALCYQGNLSQGQEHLEMGLHLAGENAQLYLKNEILLSLADCHIRQAQWEQAAAYLREAAPLTAELEDEISLPLIQLGWAQIHRAAGRVDEALTAARESVALNRELDDPAEVGMSLRVLGETLWAEGRQPEAVQAYEESLAVLGELFPYETAKTELAWGQCLKSMGQGEAANQLLKKAQQVFERLGAEQELGSISQISGVD